MQANTSQPISTAPRCCAGLHGSRPTSHVVPQSRAAPPTPGSHRPLPAGRSSQCSNRRQQQPNPTLPTNPTQRNAAHQPNPTLPKAATTQPNTAHQPNPRQQQPNPRQPTTPSPAHLLPAELWHRFQTNGVIKPPVTKPGRRPESPR